MLQGKKIYIGADHGGWLTKEYLKKYLTKKNWQVTDLGNTKFIATDDFPDFVRPVAEKISQEKNSWGILICGTGQGVCIMANKFKKIRAGLGWSVATAKRARHDNDTNILCLSGWSHTHRENARIVEAWLKTPFSQSARSQRRIKKIHD
jgi:ribose 5-phosphate isomerase B